MSSDNEKYISHLREMIACRTVSEEKYYNADEFGKLDEVLKKNYPLVFEKGENLSSDGSTFLRIAGRDSVSPLVLMSHKDVVHEGKKKWKAPPFEGKVINGKMYGRGTFDCKASLCCLFEAVESLLEEGYIPEKDIFILSTSTEETAGPDASDAVEWFRNNGIVPGLVIDEGGAVLKNPFPSSVKRFAMIGAVERSSARFVADLGAGVDAKKAGRTIKKLRPGKFEITPEVEALARGLSEYLRFPLGNLAKLISTRKKAAAFIMTHAGPDARGFCGALTGFSIPTEEEKAELEEKYGKLENPLRFYISGNYYNKLENLAGEVKKALSGFNMKIVSETIREADDPVSPSSFGFRTVGETAKSVFGSIETLPYPVLGRTDARYFIGFAENVIRFIPLEISLMQMTKFHCPNENIFTSSLPGAVAFYREVIKRYTGTEVSLK